MIEDLMEQSNPTVAPYAKEGEMFVRVTAKAATKEEADAMCVPVVEELKKRIGNFVYGVDVETLEELVVSELKRRARSLRRRNPARAVCLQSALRIFRVPPPCLRQAA